MVWRGADCGNVTAEEIPATSIDALYRTRTAEPWPRFSRTARGRTPHRGVRIRTRTAESWSRFSRTARDSACFG